MPGIMIVDDNFVIATELAETLDLLAPITDASHNVGKPVTGLPGTDVYGHGEYLRR